MERRVKGERRVIAAAVALAALVALLAPQRIQFAVRRGQVVHCLEGCPARRLALPPEAIDPRIERRLKLYPKDWEAMLDYIMRFDASMGHEWNR